MPFYRVKTGALINGRWEDGFLSEAIEARDITAADVAMADILREHGKPAGGNTHVRLYDGERAVIQKAMRWEE